MSLPEKCKKCGFRLPPGRIARCPMCKTALTQTQMFRRPILPEEPPPAALVAGQKPVEPPPEIVEKIKRHLARELFGDSDAQLDALVEGEPEAPPEEERPRAEDI